MIQSILANVGITEKIPGYSHCDGMWFEGDKHSTYRNMAIAICDKFHPLSVLEFGCGAGSLAWHIRDYSPTTTVVTLDGNPDTVKSPYVLLGSHFVCRTDYDLMLLEGERIVKFDLLLSFEHFEHIQESRFNVFMNNFMVHANPGAVLMATAATWKYPDGSDIHCNVKTKEEWDVLLKGFGLLPIDCSLLNEGTKPFNFLLGSTNELIYRFP